MTHDAQRREGGGHSQSRLNIKINHTYNYEFLFLEYIQIGYVCQVMDILICSKIKTFDLLLLPLSHPLISSAKPSLWWGIIWSLHCWLTHCCYPHCLGLNCLNHMLLCFAHQAIKQTPQSSKLFIRTARIVLFQHLPPVRLVRCGVCVALSSHLTFLSNTDSFWSIRGAHSGPEWYSQKTVQYQSWPQSWSEFILIRYYHIWWSYMCLYQELYWCICTVLSTL